MTPRCAEPMRRYEACNGPMLDDPVCGRPAGHPGRHRSQEAMARYSRAQAERRAPVQASQNRRRRTRRLHERLAPVVEAAAVAAREAYRRAA